MKYQVKLAPVSPRNQSRVTIQLTRILGQGARATIKKLVKDGGVVSDNLTKAEADRMAGQLRNLGAMVEVNQVKPDVPQKSYRLKLISAGDKKVAVIKEIRSITGLGLKESKLIVDNLGVISVFENEKDAYNGKEKLERVGANAVVEQIHDREPKPEPQPEPNPTPQPEPGPRPQPDSKPNTVYGKVTDINKRPLQNLEVEIYDVDMRHWYLLGKTLTDQDGEYQVEWTLEKLDDWEYKTVDIAVKVFTFERGSLLYETTLDYVHFNASKREEINITISKPLPGEEIEFDLFVRKVKFLAGSVDIGDLQENREHRDVTFLSKKLDVPADKIEHLVIAHRLQKLSKIDAAFFYALFRKDTLLHNDFANNLNAKLSLDIGVDDRVLLYDAALTDNKKIETDIKAAVEELIVAPKEIKNIKRNLELLSIYSKKAEEYYKNEHPKKAIE